VSILAHDAGAVIARSVKRARSPWERTVGLIGAGRLTPDDGLWLEPCTAVHTFGMRFPIDVVLLDAARRVLEVISGAGPMRLFISHPGTAIVVELPSGTAARTAITIGSVLNLV
jgi:uncharacterized membrane protein (UPF0127 family)